MLVAVASIVDISWMNISPIYLCFCLLSFVCGVHLCFNDNTRVTKTHWNLLVWKYFSVRVCMHVCVREKEIFSIMEFFLFLCLHRKIPHTCIIIKHVPIRTYWNTVHSLSPSLFLCLVLHLFILLSLLFISLFVVIHLWIFFFFA